MEFYENRKNRGSPQYKTAKHEISKTAVDVQH